MRVIPDIFVEQHIFNDFTQCRHWLRQVLEKENGLDEELKMLKEAKK